ncbi:MAG: GIY-YIG nuclease family protein, partial [Bacteroidota bacterium]
RSLKVGDQSNQPLQALSSDIFRLRKREKPIYYVHINIKSEAEDWRYVGFTSDLRERFINHNQGKVASTKKTRI